MKPIYRCRVCGAYTEEPIHCGVKAELILDGQRRLRLSKLVSAILRHFPWEAGLEPDEAGWVRVRDLVRGIRGVWRNRSLYQWVREEHVIALAQLDPKGRFQLQRRGGELWIRAAYGHSYNVNLGYEPLKPGEAPRILYHGTTARSLESILREGLKRMRRIAVHLTTDLETAVETARRHGRDVVVLVVDTRCLEERGVPLYKASERIYLAPHVPPECIRVHPRSAEPPAAEHARGAQERA